MNCESLKNDSLKQNYFTNQSLKIFSIKIFGYAAIESIKNKQKVKKLREER